jgi:hypothetical protein
MTEDDDVTDPKDVAQELIRRKPIPEFDVQTLVLLRQLFNPPPERKRKART